MEHEILVIGGAGYIGSHMVKRLKSSGYIPIILDNLSQGIRDATKGSELVIADVGDVASLENVFRTHTISAVMHFASYIQVGESVRLPGKYYANNVGNTIQLLEAMVKHDVKNFIFSSTAAIFGEPQYVPIDENHPKAPINPYGKSKWMVEQILEDFQHAHGLKSICLRYFNAAGADPEGELGECHEPETHLIPLILQVAAGRRDSITVYGNDYETHDGTCIRDYVHVEDLCEAHLLALDALLSGCEGGRYNLGNGNGHSVAEVIAAVERVTGVSVKRTFGARRDGDPPQLVADSQLVKQELGWTPRLADLDTIIQHAWNWERKYFAGRGAVCLQISSASINSWKLD